MTLTELDRLYFKWCDARDAADQHPDEPEYWTISEVAWQEYEAAANKAIAERTEAQLAEIQADYDMTIAGFLASTRL